MKKVTVKVVKMQGTEDLDLPKYETALSAGMDVKANVTERTVVKPNETTLISTGLKMAIPDGYELQIRPRSGLALKAFITIPNSPSTIDADYRGEVKIMLRNEGVEDFIINRGDRIAQMILNEVPQIVWDLVESLDDTERGEGGFGHTGK